MGQQPATTLEVVNNPISIELPYNQIMSPTTRIKRYIKAKKDPAMAMVEYMEQLDVLMEGMIVKALEARVGKAEKDFGISLDKIRKTFPAISIGLAQELRKEVYKNPERFVGLTGREGKRGEKGEPGAPAKKPVAGVDYPSYEQIQVMVQNLALVPGIDYPSTQQFKDMVKSFIPDNKVLTKLIEQILKKNKINLDPKKIARSLETLKGTERLDYYALKNLPDIPREKKTTNTKGVLRGGGEKTEYYDLSDLTDGVTKSFTIPRNKKIIWVSGTDSPAGQYRQDIDYTGSGTTTLTLTAEVAAPTQGATLHILYIP